MVNSSLIGYARGEAGGGRLERPRDPRCGTELEPDFYIASEEELVRAAELAAAAAPAYAALDPVRRMVFLEAVADVLEARAEPILERYLAESGLERERGESELARTANQLRCYAVYGASDAFLQPERVEALDGQPQLYSRRVPLGPVLVFGASNFPLAYSACGGDVASALAAGCPVIAFAHSAHPGTAALVGEVVLEVAREQGLPEGIYSLMFGRGSKEGDFLVRHAAIRAVGFTGSREAGEAIGQATRERDRPIPVFAEMSSVNPIVFGPQALAAGCGEIAATVFQSVTTGAGQFCTCPGLLLVPRGEAGDEFVEALARQFVRDGSHIMLNLGIARDYREGCERLEASPGVRLLAEGDDDEDEVKAELRASGQSRLFETDEEPFLEHLAVQGREVFGPSTLLVRLRHLRSAAAVLDALGGQLTTSFFLEPGEMGEAGETIAAAERGAGRIIFNGVPTGVRVCPAQVHGGPYPATFDGSTSVGEHALDRWVRRLAWQNAPMELLGD